MQELKAEKPIESPEGTDPVLRLMDRLGEEGFTTEQGPEWWDEYGEVIYRRAEKLPLTRGETVFIFTRLPELNERVLRQTHFALVNAAAAQIAYFHRVILAEHALQADVPYETVGANLVRYPGRGETSGGRGVSDRPGAPEIPPPARKFGWFG